MDTESPAAAADIETVIESPDPIPTAAETAAAQPAAAPAKPGALGRWLANRQTVAQLEERLDISEAAVTDLTAQITDLTAQNEALAAELETASEVSAAAVADQATEAVASVGFDPAELPAATDEPAPLSVAAQYRALENREDKAAFFKAHRAELLGCDPTTF